MSRRRMDPADLPETVEEYRLMETEHSVRVALAALRQQPEPPLPAVLCAIRAAFQRRGTRHRRSADVEAAAARIKEWARDYDWSRG